MVLTVHDVKKYVAMVSVYGPPNQQLYNDSSKTYISVQSFRDIDVRVIDIKCILSVVMLAPDHRYGLAGSHANHSEVDRWFLMEKPGLKISQMIGQGEELTDEIE